MTEQKIVVPGEEPAPAGGTPPGDNEATKLARALLEAAPGIEHLTVAYSPTGKPNSVLTATTGPTPVMWVLGALDYVRYHCFNLLDQHRAYKMQEQLEADLIARELRAQGRLN